MHDTREVASISVAELCHGVQRATSPHRAGRLCYLWTCPAPLSVVPCTEHTAYEHARLWAQLEAAGKSTDSYDMIVAATAIERASPVATFNTCHFDVVPGLTTVLDLDRVPSGPRPLSQEPGDCTMVPRDGPTMIEATGKNGVVFGGML
jgi:predicted nucleic acid-binding protein